MSISSKKIHVENRPAGVGVVVLGSVGGLVVVISNVVDDVGGSDAEVVLETVEGYVTSSLIRFVVLVSSVDISIENVVLSVVVDIVIVVVEMVSVAGLELKILVVEYIGVVGDNVVLVCSEGFAMSAAKAFIFINGVVLVVLELGNVDDSAVSVLIEVVMVLVCMKGVGEIVVDDDRIPSAAAVVEVADTELGVIADAVVEVEEEVGVVGVLVRIN